MKKFFSLVVLAISIQFTVQSQCTNNNTLALNATPPCPGTQTISNVSGGTYYPVNVVAGNTYTFSTCGNTAFDTQITVLNGATVVGYNDDACGLQSEVTWVATFTGTVNVLIDQFNCQNTGTGAQLVVECTLPVQSGNGCNTDVTICTPGQAGPFGFSTPGNPVGSCLDWIGLNYGYIVLYITQSGPLQLLIDGDATSGFLDVAIFDIPSGQDPCVAIENPANEISCNYADFSNGCNEIGSYFPCTSEVPSPNVSAGDVLMIVVENWSSASGGGSSNFTMNLAPPPAAQTGPPDPTITPVGPFCSTDGAVQLTAADMGGTWTGTATTTDGLFNPTTAGVGTYTIDYAIGSGPCLATSQTTIDVIDCSAPCNFDYISSNTSACQTGSVFTVDGQFSYLNNPGTGQVIVEITNGSGTWTQTFNAPFVDGQLYNYNISGLTADGSPAVITIYFTNDPSCEITQNITSPAACNCAADIGTFTVTTDGTQVGNNITLCFGDVLDIETNDDWVAPGIANNPPGPVYDPGVSWLIYSCPPTVALVPDLVQTVPNDPCILGVVSDFDLIEINDQFWIDAYPPGTFTNNIVYFVPITMYSIADGFYSYVNTSMPCYEMGPVYAVQYLPEIDATPTENCAAGTVSVVVSGGLPAINGSNFTGQNLVPGTATFTTATAPNGGTIVVGGLQDGDNYSFDIVDANGCPVTITGTFVGGQDASFSYPQNIYCKNATNPSATITGTPGGTFTASPGGLSINAATGAINLTASTVGTYTVTYTTPGPVCPDTETFSITINPVPTATIAGTITVCQNAPQPTITFTGANGTAPYTFSYNLNGGATQTITSVVTTATINVPTTTTGTFTYNLLSVQDASATGCSQAQAGTATITVNPNPAPVITGATQYCTGQSSILSTTVPYATYNWSTGDNTPTTTVTIADNPITVTVTTAAGCSATSAVFTVSENSVLVYDETIEICQGDFALIHGNNETVSGVYSQTFTLPSGCDSTSNITLVVNPLPAVYAGVDQEVCVGVQTTLSASGAGNYVWNNGVADGVAFTQAVGTITYTVTGTDANGCQDTDQVDVTVNPIPSATILGTNDVCINGGDQTITFTGANGTAPYTFTYTLNGGAQQTVTSTGNTAIVTMTPSSVGTFTYALVSVEDASATTCSQTQVGNAVITVNGLPNVSAGNDFTVCEDESIVLTGSGASSYVWDNGVTNGVAFTPTGITTYTVTGTDANGCVNTDQVTVTVSPNPPVSFVADITSGCAPLTVTFTNTTPGILDDCIWNFGNGLIATGCGSVTVTFTQPGLFDVSLATSYNGGCQGIATYNDYIYVEANPIASFTPSSVVLSVLNAQVQFDNTSTNATEYTWDFGDESPGSTEVSPVHTFPNVEPGSYIVELIATSPLGCVDTAVRVIIVNEELIFYIPNTFTPDGDDYNEYFQAIFTSGYDPYDFNLYIFNRWGEVIWESHNAEVGWDGTYGVGRSELVQDGTYTWKIDFKTTMNDERIEVVGHVNVIR